MMGYCRYASHTQGRVPDEAFCNECRNSISSAESPSIRSLKGLDNIESLMYSGLIFSTLSANHTQDKYLRVQTYRYSLPLTACRTHIWCSINSVCCHKLFWHQILIVL